ncbi:MAG: hypothetical protein UHX00_05250 [Caryophanon sp.]|nr:hypothetical protein [Caryophanon sp.]
MSESRTYIPYVPDDLVKALDPLAALLACKLGTFADEKGAVCVSFAYLAEMWGVDKRQIIKAADKLSALQIWHYQKHHGRGLVTEWQKGTNFAPFVTLEKVQNLQKKGTNFAPNNKDYKKDRLISARACAKSINQNLSLTNAGETPATHDNMDEFEQFWKAFFFGKYAKAENDQSAYKDRAHAVWNLMPDEKRSRCLADIKQGKRYDRTEYILWYLQHYSIPLPIWYAGDPELTPQMVSNLIVVKFRGQVAYIRHEDKDEWIKKGVKLFN